VTRRDAQRRPKTGQVGEPAPLRRSARTVEARGARRGWVRFTENSSDVAKEVDAVGMGTPAVQPAAGTVLSHGSDASC